MFNQTSNKASLLPIVGTYSNEPDYSCMYLQSRFICGTLLDLNDLSMFEI